MEQQLLTMGFPADLAAQALAATGGNSILQATEWILSYKPPNPNPNQNPNVHSNPNPNSNPSPHQPKLDRFFNFNTRKPPPPSPTPAPPHSAAVDRRSSSPNMVSDNSANKRQRIQISESKSQELTGANCEPLRLGFSKNGKSHEPLSERMRPRMIDDVVGQDHLLGESSLLRSAIRCDRIPSLILWGPPGTGKTSIAKSIVNSSASKSMYRFVMLSAVNAGVKDVRDVVEDARKMRVKSGKRTVLFVDEVHRFNKGQQDSFLPVIEDGSIVFMGATTENPSFHLNTPLLSRCRVLMLRPLDPCHVGSLLKRAVDDVEKGVVVSVGVSVEVNEDAIEFLAENCDGDARVALNALEISATTAAARVFVDRQSECSREEVDGNSERNEENRVKSSVAVVNLGDVKEALQCKHLAYDRDGEEHYNLISALHKSMRGNDANAAIYWLARMLEGGEQPLYIARRLVRFASEDVGLADPSALNQAVACYQACHFIGMPECDVILAQCVAYLASAPKSIAVYRALGSALKAVKDSVGQNEGVPLHLRNAPTKLMKEVGYGKDYIYTPDNPDAYQSFLPPSLQGYKFLDWPPETGH